MIKEEKEHKYRKLIKIGESKFKNGKIDSGGFWKLLKRVKKKTTEKAHCYQFWSKSHNM